MTSDHNLAEPSTSVSMLQRARAGDADGWQRLAQVYGPIVYSWARRCGCQSADAADVMQDTFASVAGAIGRFDHDQDGATFRGWLWTIVRNKLRDRARADDDQYAVGGTQALIAMQQVPAPLKGFESSEPPSEVVGDEASVRHRALEVPDALKLLGKLRQQMQTAKVTEYESMGMKQPFAVIDEAIKVLQERK